MGASTHQREMKERENEKESLHTHPPHGYTSLSVSSLGALDMNAVHAHILTQCVFSNCQVRVLNHAIDHVESSCPNHHTTQLAPKMVIFCTGPYRAPCSL